MSRDDLLADLTTEAAARPAAPASAPTAAPAARGGRPTPSFDVRVTPLRWSLPSVGPVAGGVGFAVRLGPLQVSAALR